MESQLKDQISQGLAWEQRNAGTEQARATLEAELRRHLEREDETTAKCAALELHLKRIGESLAQTNDMLAKEEASRAAAQRRIEELSELQIAAGRELVERTRQEKQLRRELEDQALELQRSKDEMARATEAARKAGEARQQIISALELQFKEGLARLTSV